MNPVFLVLYAVTVTLVITLVIPRLQHLSPKAKAGLRVLFIAGLLLLLLVLALRVLAGM